MFKHVKKISVVFVLLIATIFVSGCTSSNNSAVIVQTATVQKQTLTSTVSISGVLLPKNTVTLSSKMLVEAADVYFQVGDKVKEGDTLIVLDTKQLKAQLSQAKAVLKQAKDAAKTAQSAASAASSAVAVTKAQADAAKINLDAAQAAYDSVKEAHDLGTATDGDLSQAYVVLQVAQAQYNTTAATAGSAAASSASAGNSATTANDAVDVAQANVNIINVQIKGATIKAPFDGIVTNRNINPGELATTGAPMMTIMEEGSLKLKGTVPQSALPMLSEGQTINVNVDIYPGRTFAGEISLIAPMSVTTGEYFPIEIEIPSTDELRPGLSARTEIGFTSQPHLTVPAGAVIAENGQTYVFTIENALAKKLPVTVGITNGKDTEVLTGLTEGQEIIYSPASALKDNMPVSKQ